ncbi:MAG: hypothetical protein ACYCV7_01210 [Acidimicrobiales bacterium]
MKIRTITLVFAVALTLGGCGSSSASSNPGLGAVKVDVAAVRSAAMTKNRNAVLGALVKLQADVARLRREGRLTAGRANTILNAASEVDANLGSLPVPTTTTTTTTTTTVPVPSTVVQPPYPGPKGGRSGNGKKDH